VNTKLPFRPSTSAVPNELLARPTACIDPVVSDRFRRAEFFPAGPSATTTYLAPRGLHEGGFRNSRGAPGERGNTQACATPAHQHVHWRPGAHWPPAPSNERRFCPFAIVAPQGAPILTFQTLPPSLFGDRCRFDSTANGRGVCWGTGKELFLSSTKNSVMYPCVPSLDARSVNRPVEQKFLSVNAGKRRATPACAPRRARTALTRQGRPV